ncbi:MAG: Radical domain protein [Bacteroidetes bacterium]|nr:Radical domain protein [Bacteroidota bacterium]
MENTKRKYQPVTAVWEVTMGCNMNCIHCGSSCNKPYADELTTSEALSLIKEMAQLGVKWVTLSGGEPLTREDLPQLIKCLRENSLGANVITNGWLLAEKAHLLKEAGVCVVAVSIDGTKEIHDTIRRQGSFERDMEGIRLLRQLGIEVGAITTITKKNLANLKELREKLIEAGVDSWQVQIGLPMGNLLKHKENVMTPEHVDEIIDFCYETALDGRIRMYPADCIGYYTVKEQEVKRRSYKAENALWEGCNAGVRGFGVLQNGDIIGCTSVRDKEFIEGNIRERSLNDIWNDENAFRWRRELKKEMLSGECQKCIYGSKCLGGCANTRLTMEGSIYGENKYCSYNVYLKKKMEEVRRIKDVRYIQEKAQEALRNDEVQVVALLAKHGVALDKNNLELYKLKGYADFMCGNYADAERSNSEALKLCGEDAYALKGLALSMYKQDKYPLEDVIRLMERANSLNGGTDNDILHDLNLLRQKNLVSR